MTAGAEGERDAEPGTAACCVADPERAAATDGANVLSGVSAPTAGAPPAEPVQAVTSKAEIARMSRAALLGRACLDASSAILMTLRCCGGEATGLGLSLVAVVASLCLVPTGRVIIVR